MVTVPGVDAWHSRYDTLFDILTVLTARINFFDSSTYPDSLLYIDRSVALNVLCLLAPPNLLGKFRFRHVIHAQPDLEIPTHVSDVLSAGARYLSPRYFKESVVTEAWDKLVPVIKRDFMTALSYDSDNESQDETHGPFHLSIPVPIYSREAPVDQDSHNDLEEALDLGRSELVRQALEAPRVVVNSRMQSIDINSAFTWLTENRVLIKQTDKNLGTVAITADWYESEVMKFITSIPFYEEISSDEANEAVHRAVRRVEFLAGHPCVTQTRGLRPFLLHKIEYTKDVDKGETFINVKIPVFHALPKIHKKVWAVRPIVPCFGVPQGPSSEYLSAILKELLPDFDSILISSKQLVIEIERLNSTLFKMMSPSTMEHNIYMASGDVSGFYTNVDTGAARNIVLELILKKYGRRQKGLAISQFVGNLYDAQQEDLVFKFTQRDSSTFWRQTRGLAMGVPAAPDVANLFAAYYEKKFSQTFMNRCLLYKRYIDDVFVIIKADSREHAESLLRENVKFPGLKINWEFNSRHCVFLDLELYFSRKWPGCVIRYRPFRKPLNSFERLPYITGHPTQMLKAAFKSEVYRIAVLSSTESIFDSELLFLQELYYSRAYPAKVVLGWTKRFKSDAWNNRLTWARKPQESSGELGSSVWPLKSLMNPVWAEVSLPRVYDIIYEHLQKEGRTDHFLEHFMRRLVASQARPSNLGDLANGHNRRVLDTPKDNDLIVLYRKGFGSRRLILTNYEFGSSSPEKESEEEIIDMDIDD